MTTAKIRVLSTFTVIAALTYALIALRVAAIGYAQGGGTIAIQSPTVEIEADSVGDVVTIGGDGNVINTAVAPIPETAKHQRGEWVFLALVVAAGFGAIAYWWHRVGGNLEFVMVSQKEPS